MVIAPDRYPTTPAYNLLASASLGHLVFDHRLLHALLDEPERTLPGILRFAAEDHTDDPVPLHRDLWAIFRTHPVPEALDYLIEQAIQLREETPEELCDAIIRQGERAIPRLLKALEEAGAEEQDGEPGESGLLFLLALLGIKSPAIFDRLVARLDEDPGDAAMLLEAYGDPAAIPYLERALESTQEAFPRSLLLRAIELLRSGRRDARTDPYDIYACYPEIAEPAFEGLPESELASFLDSDHAPHRENALRRLADDVLPARLSGHVIEVAESDPEPRVRGAAWEALQETLAEEEDLHERATARLKKDATPREERVGLMCALAHAGNPPWFQAIVEDAYAHPPTRAKALEAMGRTLDRGYRDHVARHLEDPDPDVQREAVCCVGYLVLPELASRLIPLFDYPSLREHALFSYAIAAPGEASIHTTKKLYGRIEELAGGFDDDDEAVVKDALDIRLAIHGRKPVFEAEQGPESPAKPAKVGRNDPCPCGSGKKYKKCCGA